MSLEERGDCLTRKQVKRLAMVIVGFPFGVVEVKPSLALDGSG